MQSPVEKIPKERRVLGQELSPCAVHTANTSQRAAAAAGVPNWRFGPRAPNSASRSTFAARSAVKRVASSGPVGAPDFHESVLEGRANPGLIRAI